MVESLLVDLVKAKS